MDEGQKVKKEGSGMSFLQHLEQLRWHLIRSAIAIMLVAIVAFIYKSFIFDTIIFGPKQPDFVSFRLLCKLSYKLHQWMPGLVEEKAICIGQSIPHLQNISMAGQFATHIIVSILAGLIIAFPYIFWEFWRFLKPALKKKEKKFTRGIVFYSTFLFSLGVLFGYFVISPLSVNFLTTYRVSETVDTIPTLSSYITTVTMVVLACGVIFELPLLVSFLTKIGLVSPKFLKKYRKHALVGALILSAIITPPDVFSQLLVSVPLLLLYEVSIWLSAAITRRAKE